MEDADWRVVPVRWRDADQRATAAAECAERSFADGGVGNDLLAPLRALQPVVGPMAAGVVPEGTAAIEPGKERALLVSVKTTEGLLKAHALARLDVTKSVRAVDLLAAAPRDRPHPHQALYGIPEGPVVGKLPANRELVDEDIHRRQPQPAKAFRSLSNWSKKPSGQESSAPSAFNVGVCTCGPSADRGEKK